MEDTKETRPSKHNLTGTMYKLTKTMAAWKNLQRSKTESRHPNSEKGSGNTPPSLNQKPSQINNHIHGKNVFSNTLTWEINTLCGRQNTEQSMDNTKLNGIFGRFILIMRCLGIFFNFTCILFTCYTFCVYVFMGFLCVLICVSLFACL